MTTGEKLTAAIAGTLIAGIVLYLIGVGQGWWKNIFAKPEKAPDKTEHEKCMEANKAKADGDACTNCVPKDSEIPSYQGEIKNGVCEQKAETVKRYIIGNANGAHVYSYSNGQWTTAKGAPVAQGTEVKIIAVSADKKYVNTDKGWLLMADIEQK